MTQYIGDPARSISGAPRHGFVGWINEHLPMEKRIRHSDAVVIPACLFALASAVLLVLNLRSAPVWAFGFNPSVPLSLQWIISFVLGATAALRIQHFRTRGGRR